MNGVIRLQPVERVVIDRDVALHAPEGGVAWGAGAPPGSTPAVALEEIAYWLYHFDAALRRGDSDELTERAERIARVARARGLCSLARVAEDLLALRKREGSAPAPGWLGPAQAAVAARLVRVGETSILSVWELQDISG